MCWPTVDQGSHRAKEAERAGHQNPDQQHHHDGAEGHSRQGVVGDGHSVEHGGDAEAHEREQVGRQQHGGDPGLAAIARVEPPAAGKQRGDAQMAKPQSYCYMFNIHKQRDRRQGIIRAAQPANVPDIACYKGRERIADDEHCHNGSSLREQCTCTDCHRQVPLPLPLHMRFQCMLCG